MDKTTLGVLSAMSALAAFSTAGAAPLSPAASFAELLDPIPNAVARLKADDAARKADPQREPAAEEDDPGCRPMSRAGCFRPARPPAQTAPSGAKPASGQDQAAPSAPKPSEG